MTTRLVLSLGLLLCSMTAASRAADDANLAELLDSARSHLKHGRYEETEELLEELIDSKFDSPLLPATRAELCLQLGRWGDAEEILQAAVETHADDAGLLARLAELKFQRGQFEATQAYVQQALKLSAEEPRGHLVLARLLTEQGKLAEAEAEYRWFVRYYNRAQPTDSEVLLLVAEGSVQYARWKSVSQIFNFSLNTLAVDALKQDANCWQSYLFSGRLLLEKYNRAQGVPELQKGLAINAQSAELLTAMGEAAAQEFDWDEARDYAYKALDVNPKLPSALRLLAEAQLQDDEVDAAETTIARTLDINPLDQETLALSAAAMLQRHGIPDLGRLKVLLQHIGQIDKLNLEVPTPFEQLVIDLARRNPRPGYFLAKLGSRLEATRKHAAAEAVYLQAIQTMPQLSQPKTQLGLMYMQTGKTREAQQLLDTAFKSDPFHVRVSNMRKVLKVLDGYDTVTTDHFVIRADTAHDRLLAKYMAEYLEEIYPALTAQYGYEPPARTQIEVYNEAKGLTAHQWFSARMIGLPWIQTIGASTGLIIAMASPTGLEEPMNWARVLKHEFVHVLTLQETEFNIPHWYTEALAVRAEGYPRPAEWDRLLVQRVPQGRVRTLDTLNLGFQRSENRDDWNFSYCLSSLYAQFMSERFGADAPAKLLDAYRRKLNTDAAIEDSFQVTKSEFEREFRDYLTKLVGELTAAEPEQRYTPAEITRAYEADATDATAAGRYAQLLLLGGKTDEARELAEDVLSREPTQPQAALVVASLKVQDEDHRGAREVLVKALNRDQPHRQVLAELAKLDLALEQESSAAEWYQLGREKFPGETAWWIGTAQVARKTGDVKLLKSALETLCDIDYDSAAYPLERAELAINEEDYAAARTYGTKALHVDVLETRVHAVLGKSWLKLDHPERGAEEFRIALELKPDDPNLQVGLAGCYVALKRTDEAKQLIDSVLGKEPLHAGATALAAKLKSLKDTD